MKNPKAFAIKSIFLSFLVVFTSLAWAANDPVQMLNGIANELINNLKAKQANLKNNPSVVYSLAHRIVVPHADIAEMARRVIPRDVWAKATASQKSRFQKEFTNLLVRTYSSALANYTNEKVRFFPIRGGYSGRNTIQVKSEIERNDGPSIAVTYRLVLRGSEWKLYDLSVEGVSMLESFRSQFADLLAQNNMNALIERLAQHNQN